MLFCVYCDRDSKNLNSLKNHERLCKSNPLRQKTWLESNRDKLVHKRCNQWTKEGSTWQFTAEHKEKMKKAALGRKHNEKTKMILSRMAKERNLGGHTSKNRLYFKKNNGEIIYLQSSYEIKFAQILEELNIEWQRPSPLEWIDNEGAQHKYYADFKVGKKYFDTKNNYLAIKDADKIKRVSEQNNTYIEIITLDKITKEYIEKALIV